MLTIVVSINSSSNGSPVDAIEDGALVATVTKKRRGGNGSGTDGQMSSTTAFDINMGDGRKVTLLDDPHYVKNLDNEVKNAALSQLKVLSDRMANLMAHLENWNKNYIHTYY